jgi:RNA polymerase sigma-70 factor (ECF subfamily)
MPCRVLSDEQDVVARFLSKPSDETFHELFRGLAPRILGYFRARGCELELAEDLTQEVMLAVYKEARSLRDKALFRPWVYRIARNALLRHLRDTGRRVETVELGAEAEGLYQTDSDLTLRSQFAEWMAWLRPEERQIMMLRYVDELEHHEIAQVLGMPLGTVQWKIFHTKRKLAARFGVKTS